MVNYMLYQVDAFTKEKLSGNPAGVILDARGLDETHMQRIARELNNSETAFIFPGDGEIHDVHVRFFTPTHEVPICGHATISAHYVRAKHLSLPSCRVLQKTGAGILPVDLIRQDNDYSIIMTQGAIEFGAVLTGNILSELAAALGVRTSDFSPDYPVQIVSTGHSKVIIPMIPILGESLIHKLAPDMQALSRLSSKIGCNGFYPFAFKADSANALITGRMFAPAVGIPEDPVTGNANGPLGAYLVQHGFLPASSSSSQFTFKAEQGVAMGRPGTMEVSVTAESGIPKLVQITGEAVITFASVLEL